VTGKERLTRAYLGQDVDRVALIPMLYQCYDVHQYDGALPAEVARCR